MPSSRAVLADIVDLGLDPKVAHTAIRASGRLGVPDAAMQRKAAKAKKLEVVKEEPKVKPALVFVAPVVETPIELVEIVESTVVLPSTDPVADEELPSDKTPAKPAKKEKKSIVS